MDEQLDNDLNNRIREVFDNFEDQSYPSADEGWLLLRKKFPETEEEHPVTKRPVAWLWWASAAAAILLFISVGVWMTGKKQQPETMAVKPVKQQHEQITTADTAKLLVAKQAPVTKNTAIAQAIDSNNISHNHASKTPVNKLANSTAASGAIANANKVSANPHVGITASQQPNNNQAAVNTIKVKPDSTKTVVPQTNVQQYAITPPPATKDSNTAAPAAANTNTITQQPVKVPKQAPANSMAALFASENTKTQKSKPEENTDDKKVRFGVYAATFFNYAKGSNNQVNAGAGFTSDIKLSKNLKFSTGLALAQNTLSYNGGPPPASNADALARAPQALVPYDKASLFSANAAFPVLKNYNASLIGLDIPMNIKYEFSPQKSDTYISAGLSSGTFINEAYTSVYGYSTSSVAAGSSQQTTDETTRKNFSGFYFAKTLNVSFGVGYPVGKANKLIIEPFLKYPLSGLGSQQIQFGAAGLNLKLNFTNKK